MNRHLLQHQGKLFSCPVEGCNRKFAYKGNIKRHIKDIHEDEEGSSSSDSQGQTQHVCQESGCGKVFKYASKLKKHEESHGKFLFIIQVAHKFKAFATFYDLALNLW